MKQHPVPEVPSGGYLADHDREPGQDWAVVTSCGVLQVQQFVQVAAQQVELSGLEVLGCLHGTPDAFWDLQKELYLGRHCVELVLPLFLALRQMVQTYIYVYICTC